MTQSEKIRKDLIEINNKFFLDNGKNVFCWKLSYTKTYLSLQLNQDKFKDFNFIQEPFDIYQLKI